MVATAKPDGNSILFIASSNMAANPFLFKSLPFDTVKDFKAAGTFAQIVFVMVVAPDSPLKTVDDVIKHLKSKKQNKYGYTNQTALMSSELFKAMTGTEAVGVSYRTAPDAMPDVTNGTLDMMIMDGTYAAGQVRAGRLRPLAVLSPRRLSQMPEVPTITEVGIADAVGVAWNGMVTRTGVPAEVINRTHREVASIMRSPAVTERLTKLSFNIVASTPEQFAEVIQSDAAKWGKVIRDFKIQVE